jgi:hypothetical protein
MSHYLEKISELNRSIESADDPAEYKHDLVQLLIEAKLSTSDKDFLNISKASELGFSSNCGCAEDLELLTSLFEQLSEHEIYDSVSQRRILENSACNRWL